ncbi:MAG: metallophosphoesterase family protein [Planctomycetota bacterium]|nr:metallophosphoesterase family protein [Planctomycetota bacterium]
MIRIGLLSDTHGYLDPLVWDYLDDRDEIWHAGDFGGADVVQQLQAAGKPLRGVFGNIDDEVVRAEFPEHLRFLCEQVPVWMTHIGGQPGRFPRDLLATLQANGPRLFICGHSHILQVGRDKSLGNMLCLNPGAAGHHGFHTLRTMLRFEIDGPQVRAMQVVELGPRGRKTPAAIVS